MNLDVKSKPLTDADLVLSVLIAWRGEWVKDMYGKTRVMVHSRIADLRRRGYQIESRRFGRGDYRYKLVSEPTKEVEA